MDAARPQQAHATLNLSAPEGREVFLKLVRKPTSSSRTSAPARWRSGAWTTTALAENPGLILVRVTGFGQTGPMARRPAFGTLAEAMSGFAFSTGQADGPPTLPPLALADNIAGLAATIADATALHSPRPHRHRARSSTSPSSSRSWRCSARSCSAYDQLGYITQRAGNRSENNAPRNTYLTKDGRWVAISSSANSIAERVMRLVGRARADRRALVRLRRRPRAARGRDRRRRRRWIAAPPAGRGHRRVRAGRGRDRPGLRHVAGHRRRAAERNRHHRRPSRTPTSARSRCRTSSSGSPTPPATIRHTGRAHGADTDEVLARARLHPAADRRAARRRAPSDARCPVAELAWELAPLALRARPSRPDRFAKAAAIADGVVIDLEDAVHPAERAEPRARSPSTSETGLAAPVVVR